MTGFGASAPAGELYGNSASRRRRVADAARRVDRSRAGQAAIQTETEYRWPASRLRQLLDHAAERGYGVPAFNINNMEQGLAIMEAAAAVDAPVIIQASRGARSYAGDIMLARMIEALDETYPAHPDLPAPGPRQRRSHLPLRHPARLHLGDDGRLAEGRRQDAADYDYNVDDHGRVPTWPTGSAPRSKASSACSARSSTAAARRRTATAPKASSATTSC